MLGMKDIRLVWRILGQATKFAFVGFFVFGLAGGFFVGTAGFFTGVLAALLEQRAFTEWIDHAGVGFLIGAYFGASPGAITGALMMLILGLIGPPERPAPWPATNYVSTAFDHIFAAAFKSMAFCTFSTCLSLCLLCAFAALFGFGTWRSNLNEYLIHIAYTVTGAMALGILIGGSFGLRRWRMEYQK